MRCSALVASDQHDCALHATIRRSTRWGRRPGHSTGFRESMLIIVTCSGDHLPQHASTTQRIVAVRLRSWSWSKSHYKLQHNAHTQVHCIASKGRKKWYLTLRLTPNVTLRACNPREFVGESCVVENDARKRTSLLLAGKEKIQEKKVLTKSLLLHCNVREVVFSTVQMLQVCHLLGKDNDFRGDNWLWHHNNLCAFASMSLQSGFGVTALLVALICLSALAVESKLVFVGNVNLHCCTYVSDYAAHKNIMHCERVTCQT